MKAKVLIIGASGHVGSYVVKELKKIVKELKSVIQQIVKVQLKNGATKDMRL